MWGIGSRVGLAVVVLGWSWRGGLAGGGGQGFGRGGSGAVTSDRSQVGGEDCDRRNRSGSGGYEGSSEGAKGVGFDRRSQVGDGLDRSRSVMGDVSRHEIGSCKRASLDAPSSYRPWTREFGASISRKVINVCQVAIDLFANIWMLAFLPFPWVSNTELCKQIDSSSPPPFKTQASPGNTRTS